MESLGIIRNYDDLHAALRARVEHLNISRTTLDELAGLTPYYSAKLLSPKQLKRIGAISLGPLLGALGLALVVVEDDEQMKRMRARYVPRDLSYVRHRADAAGSEKPSTRDKPARSETDAAPADLDELERVAEQCDVHVNLDARDRRGRKRGQGQFNPVPRWRRQLNAGKSHQPVTLSPSTDRAHTDERGEVAAETSAPSLNEPPRLPA